MNNQRYKVGLLGDQPKAFDLITSAIQAKKQIIKLVGFAGCFTGDTMVAIPGGYTAIKNIRRGDHALSYGPDGPEWKSVVGTFCFEVAHVKHNMLILHLKDGTMIKCTSDHEFYTPRGYTAAIELAWRAMGEDTSRHGVHGEQPWEALKQELQEVREGCGSKTRTGRTGLSTDDAQDQRALSYGEGSSDRCSDVDTKSREQRNSQSQERGQYGQQDRESGMGDTFGEHKTCFPDGTGKQSGREQSVLENDGDASSRDTQEISTVYLYRQNVGRRLSSVNDVHQVHSSAAKLEARCLMPEDILYVEVVPVFGAVYDLQVEDNHNYCITSHNLVVHNSGKTHMLRTIVEWAKHRGYEVVLAAPTHKAAGVIREKLGDLGADVKTIHSLLGFGMPMDLEGNTGERKLTKTRDTVLKGLVICDEGSMVGEVLLQEIKTQSRAQWLFVGDSAQLAPVGEKVSELLNNPDAVLEKPIRQAEGSEILALATNVRRGDLSLGYVSGRDVASVPDKGELFEAAFQRFTDPRYQDDPNFARMLVFRNSERRAINDRMRSNIVDTSLTVPYAPGEWLVMYTPYNAPTKYDKGARRFLTIEETFEKIAKQNKLANEAKVFFKDTGSKSRWRAFFEYKESFAEYHLHTSQEVLVVDAAEDVADVDEDWWTPFKMWNLTIKADGLVYKNFPVLDRSEYDNLRAAMADQRRQAMEYAELSQVEYDEPDQQRREAWRRYFLLKELFAHVDYAFCCTTHKAQGSTFNHVYVDVPDLMRSSMKQRLLYVALTRASDSLTFCQ